jgi:hypothetical protein
MAADKVVFTWTWWVGKKALKRLIIDACYDSIAEELPHGSPSGLRDVTEINRASDSFAIRRV